MLALSLCAAAQDKTVKKIIELGQTDNNVMELEDFLSNRIGGRMVGTHQLQDAEKWVEKQFRSWGLDVMVQEVGEINVGFTRGQWSGRMLGEDGMTLHFGTPAYTAGTKGPQKGHVVIEPASKAEFDRMKGKLAGAWVLVDSFSSALAIDSTPEADAKRAATLEENAGIEKQNAEIRRWNRENPDAQKELVKTKPVSVPFYRQMVEAGVLGFIVPGELPLQILYDRANCYNLTMDTLPTVCDIRLDINQFKAIRQKVADRQEVLLEFDIRNYFFEGPVKYHNVIGILRGSKYPDEYVITGGHLDAYDGATGAVDDAQGTCVTMETARLLALSGAKPKRSIMFAVWTGEEYGLLGSRYFVENNTVKLDKISNYFNRDGGPEVATSITVIPSMYDDFKKICEPLESGLAFPFKVNRNEAAPGPRPTSAGGSDHAYFAMNGVPTVSLNLTDVNGYDFRYRDIWHTDKDLFNQIHPEYLEHSSLVNAVVVYGVANLDHLLSRDGLYKQ